MSGGTSYDVRCAACGFAQDSVVGIDRGFGQDGYWIVTVACPEKKCLYDVTSGSIEDCEIIVDDGSRRALSVENSDDTIMMLGEPPADIPDNCPGCGQTHVMWDKLTATCPACGTAGCEITEAGFWD